MSAMQLTDDEQLILVESLDSCLEARDFELLAELLEEVRPDWPELADRLREAEGFLEQAIFARSVVVVLATKYASVF